MGFNTKSKNLFHFIALMSMILIGWSCVPSEGDEDASCGATEEFDATTRSCISTATGVAPQVTLESATITEDTTSTVTIAYRNTPSSEVATGCDVDNGSLAGLAEQANCSCAAGTCTVNLIGLPNRTASGNFQVALTDADLVFGDYKTVKVNFTAVNDAPILCPITLSGADALDGDDCGGTDCIAGGNPTTPFTLGVTPDYTVDNAPDNANEKYFWDSASSVCYRAGGGIGAWTALNVAGFPTKCDFTEDINGVVASKPATDCVGGDGNDCTGAADPANNDAPGGTVYFNSNSGQCFAYSENTDTWVSVGNAGEHVIAIAEDTTVNIGTINFLAGYDPDGDSLTKSYVDTNTDTVGAFTCTDGSDNCFYLGNSNENFNDDGSSGVTIADQTDTLTYTITDPDGLNSSLTIRPIVREVNDAPDVPDSTTITAVNEDVDISIANGNHFTLTIASSAGTNNILDIDDTVIQTFTFASNGTDTCNAATSDLDDTVTVDNVYTCDILSKGLWKMTVTGVSTSLPATDTEVLNIEFFPNSNYNGTATVAFSTTDSFGATSDTGVISVTHNAVNDNPTFCQFSTDAIDDADNDLCGNIDCSSAIDPDTLSDLDGTPDSEMNFLSSANANFGFPTYTSGAYDQASSGIFHRQGTGCEYANPNTDTWTTLNTFNCPFSTGKADCSTEPSSNCTGADSGVNVHGAPTLTGLVHFETSAGATAPLTCYISDSGGATWTAATGSWVLRTSENTDGTTQLTFGSDPENQLPTPRSIDNETGATETLTLTFSNPSNGAMMGCTEGDNQTGAGPFTNCTGFLPTQYFSGEASFQYTVTDNGTGTLAETITISVAVEEGDSSPILTYGSGAALDGTTIEANEGSIIQLYDLKIDESPIADTSEDSEDILITISSSNTAVLPNANISFFWEDSGQEFMNTKNMVTTSGAAVGLTAGAGSGNEVESAGLDAASNVFGLKLVTTPGAVGTSNVSIEVADDSAAPSTTITFTVNVNAIGVQHNGWDNIHAVGPLVRKAADYRDCDAAGEFTLQGATENPNVDTASYPPTNGNVYQDQANEICFVGDGTQWLPRGCDYSDAATAGTNCNSADCYGSGAPSYGTPTTSGLRYSDYTNNVCYISVASDGWYPEGSYTHLAWGDFTISGSTIGGWQVFRRRTDQEFDYSSPVSTISGNTSTLRKVFDVVSSADKNRGYVYRYEVLPVDANSRLVFPQETFKEIGVMIPPQNQVFVHRRVLNKEVCSRIGQTSDKTDDNSCDYDGAGGVDTDADNVIDKYKLSTNFLVDRYELGCDYTSAVNQTLCTGGSPCLGTSATTPTTLAAGEFFYERDSGNCLMTDGGGGMQNISAGTAAELDQTIFRNHADLPPIVNVTQTQADTICNARSATTAIVIEKDSASAVTDTLAGSDYRIMNRTEFVALAAWDDTDSSLTDSSITSTELGSDLDISSKCNSNTANGVSDNFSDAETPLSAFSYTSPGTSSSTIRQLASGSDFTRDCVSKYGIVDLIGNVREWNGNQIGADLVSVQAVALDAVSGAFNMTDGDEATYAFDNTPTTTNGNQTGPDLETAANSSTTWTIANKDNSATRFDLPIGLPIDQAGTPNFLIGQTSGITSAQLHSDDILVDADGGTVSGFISGGSHSSGTGAGRYKVDIIDIATSDTETGFRCIAPLSTSITQ